MSPSDTNYACKIYTLMKKNEGSFVEHVANMTIVEDM